jgi:hypothetical protein
VANSITHLVLRDECNYQFATHLQDIFDIISHLQSDNFASKQQEFLYFLHRRGFRKLSWRLWKFLTHWGKSPFEILAANVDALKAAEPDLHLTIPISLSKTSHNLILAHQGNEEIPLTDDSPITSNYTLDAENVASWVLFFQKAVTLLKKQLPRKSEEPPDNSATVHIVVMIQLLQAFKPMIAYLFSRDVVVVALEDAGMFHLWSP